jgi:nitrate reductase alpha subunit
MDKLGNGGKGISWNTDHEVRKLLKKLNRGASSPALARDGR